MGTGILTIDLDAVASNWRALDALSAPGIETAATVKADAYGLGVAPVARALHAAGARRFFVAVAEEGAVLRDALGPGPAIHVYSGHMPGDAEALDVPEDELEDRLIRRWLDHGHDYADARRRARSNDIPNAHRVLAKRAFSTLTI